MISGHTRIFGLVGHPVRHSLSPAMHNELFRRLGIDAVYVAFEVDPAQAERVPDALRTLRLGGVNLTVPFKERVVPLLDELAPIAAAAGAVNVVLQKDGRLIGHNADGEGYLHALEVEMGVSPRGLHAAVLGAGGSGRAVAAALATAGAAQVDLFNRTAARAEAAVEALAHQWPGTRFRALPLDPAAFVAPYDLVVNSTAPAGSPAVDALSVAHLPTTCVWTDTNYYLPDPPALRACASRGVRVQRGIGMLLHQGALSFGLFTGVNVDPAVVRGVMEIGGW